MLQEFNEETLHIALETLTVVIKADAQAAAAWEHRVSPAVLQVWAAHVADPLIALDSTDVLQALAANPAALPSLQVGCSFALLPRHWSCSGILAGHADNSRCPRLAVIVAVWLMGLDSADVLQALALLPSLQAGPFFPALTHG